MVVREGGWGWEESYDVGLSGFDCPPRNSTLIDDSYVNKRFKKERL